MLPCRLCQLNALMAEIWVHNTILVMLERIQMRFCKYALGVGRSTPTLAVLGELG